MSAARKDTTTASTKDAVFESAARLFANGGFDGVSVDDIAKDAGVNKAMIYYHFADKLALYRAVLADGLGRMGATAHGIAAAPESPSAKLDRFIEAFVRMTEQRPWMPALMLREIAEGAPRLDAPTLEHMRMVIGSFVSILTNFVRFSVPMIYPYSLVDDRFGAFAEFYLLNPIADAVLLVQQAFWVGTTRNPEATHAAHIPDHLFAYGFLALGVSAIMLLVAQLIFTRFENRIPERL